MAKINKKNLLIALTFFTISLILYLYKLPKLATFDYDQEFYASEYQKIVEQRKLTLIGMETSVGGMFVGPLYTYFSALIYWIFSGNPIGIFIVTIIISSLNPVLTFFIFNNLKNWRIGLIGGLLVLFNAQLWSKGFMPSVIHLLYPMGLLFFYFLIKLDENKKNLFWLGMLLGLSLHIHFSLFLFFPITVFYLLKKKSYLLFWQFRQPTDASRIRIKLTDSGQARVTVLSIFLIFLFSLPLLIFDFRHEFLISQNFFKFLFQPSESYSLFLQIMRITRSIVDTLTFALNVRPNILETLLLLFIAIFLRYKRQDKTMQIAFLIYVISFLLLIFYKGPLPDYYFFYLLAPFFYIVSTFIVQIGSNKYLRLLIIIYFSVIWSNNLQTMLNAVNPYNFFQKIGAAKYIKFQTQDQTVKIFYDTDLGLGFGFKYLLDYAGVKQVDNNAEQAFQIVIRKNHPALGKEFKEEGIEEKIKVVKLTEK